MTKPRNRWAAFDRALWALRQQFERSGLFRLTERELADAAEEEKQAYRRERREQRERGESE